MCKCDGKYDDNYAFFTTYHVVIRKSQHSSCTVKKIRNIRVIGYNTQISIEKEIDDRF